MDIFSFEGSKRIGDDDPLQKVDTLIDWVVIEKILHRGLGRSGFGPKGYDPLLLFKRLLLGQWHGLSGPSLERSLRVRLDFMLFCGLDLHSNCLLYTSPSPRDQRGSRMPSSA